MSFDHTLKLRLIVDDSSRVNFQRFSRKLHGIEYGLNRIGFVASRIALVGIKLLTAQMFSFGLAIGWAAKEFLRINEQFAQFEITVGSSLRSLSAAGAITRELARYTAKSPIPFQQLAESIQSFAIIPQTRQRLLQQALSGNLADERGFLKEALMTVQAMAAFRPDQGAGAAVFSIREAMGGQMRSLLRRFDIPIRLLTDVSGLTLEQLKNNANDMLDAIGKVFQGIISPAAIEEMARQPELLWQNAMEQLTKLPFLYVGGEGAYKAILTKLQSIFDDITEFVSTTFSKEYAPRISEAFTEALSETQKALQYAMAQFSEIFNVDIGAGNYVEQLFRLTEFFFSRVFEAIPKIIKGIADNLESVLAVFGVLKNLLLTFFNILKAIATYGNKIADLFGGGHAGTYAAVMAAFASPAILANIGTIVRGIASSVLSGLMGGVLRWQGATSLAEKTAEGRLSAYRMEHQRNVDSMFVQRGNNWRYLGKQSLVLNPNVSGDEIVGTAIRPGQFVSAQQREAVLQQSGLAGHADPKLVPSRQQAAMGARMAGAAVPVPHRGVRGMVPYLAPAPLEAAAKTATPVFGKLVYAVGGVIGRFAMLALHTALLSVALMVFFKGLQKLIEWITVRTRYEEQETAAAKKYQQLREMGDERLPEFMRARFQASIAEQQQEMLSPERLSEFRGKTVQGYFAPPDLSSIVRPDQSWRDWTSLSGIRRRMAAPPPRRYYSEAQEELVREGEIRDTDILSPQEKALIKQRTQVLMAPALVAQMRERFDKSKSYLSRLLAEDIERLIDGFTDTFAKMQRDTPGIEVSKAFSDQLKLIYRKHGVEATTIFEPDPMFDTDVKERVMRNIKEARYAALLYQANYYEQDVTNLFQQYDAYKGMVPALRKLTLFEKDLPVDLAADWYMIAQDTRTKFEDSIRPWGAEIVALRKDIKDATMAWVPTGELQKTLDEKIKGFKNEFTVLEQSLYDRFDDLSFKGDLAGLDLEIPSFRQYAAVIIQSYVERIAEGMASNSAKAILQVIEMATGVEYLRSVYQSAFDIKSTSLSGSVRTYMEALNRRIEPGFQMRVEFDDFQRTAIAAQERLVTITPELAFEEYEQQFESLVDQLSKSSNERLQEAGLNIKRLMADIRAYPSTGESYEAFKKTFAGIQSDIQGEIFDTLTGQLYRISEALRDGALKASKMVDDLVRDQLKMLEGVQVTALGETYGSSTGTFVSGIMQRISGSMKQLMDATTPPEVLETEGEDRRQEYAVRLARLAENFFGVLDKAITDMQVPGDTVDGTARARIHAARTARIQAETAQRRAKLDRRMSNIIDPSTFTVNMFRPSSVPFTDNTSVSLGAGDTLSAWIDYANEFRKLSETSMGSLTATSTRISQLQTELAIHQEQADKDTIAAVLFRLGIEKQVTQEAINRQRVAAAADILMSPESIEPYFKKMEATLTGDEMRDYRLPSEKITEIVERKAMGGLLPDEIISREREYRKQLEHDRTEFDPAEYMRRTNESREREETAKLSMTRRGFDLGFAKEIRESLMTIQELGASVAQSLSSAFGNAFAGFVNGSKSAKEAMRDFAYSFMNAVAQMLAQQAALRILGLFLGSVGTPAASPTPTVSTGGSINPTLTTPGAFNVTLAPPGRARGGLIPHFEFGGAVADRATPTVVRLAPVMKYAEGGAVAAKGVAPVIATTVDRVQGSAVAASAPPLKFAQGGALPPISVDVLPRYAAGNVISLRDQPSGGVLKGGSGYKDDLPILAMGGEYIIRKDRVQEFGEDFFDEINFNGRVPEYADGGKVGNTAKSVAANSGGNTSNINIATTVNVNAQGTAESQTTATSNDSPMDQIGTEMGKAIDAMIADYLARESRPGRLVDQLIKARR